MKGAGSRTTPGASGAASLCTLLFLGCASHLMAVDGVFRNVEHGYSILAPGDPAWRRIDLEGTDLAYRRPGPATMSLQSRCGKPVAEAQIMARHLVIGVRERTVRQAGPVPVSGGTGWTQTFDTLHDGVGVRVKTVTLVGRGCTFDWTLVAAGRFEEAEPSFDAWWGSFRLDGAEPPAEAGT